MYVCLVVLTTIWFVTCDCPCCKRVFFTHRVGFVQVKEIDIFIDIHVEDSGFIYTSARITIHTDIYRDMVTDHITIHPEAAVASQVSKWWDLFKLGFRNDIFCFVERNGAIHIFSARCAFAFKYSSIDGEITINIEDAQGIFTWLH